MATSVVPANRIAQKNSEHVFFTTMVFVVLAAAHKRFMLAAMLDMLQPALGRALPSLLGTGGPLILFAPIPFLLTLPAWDFYSRGRLHYSTVWGIGLVLLRITARR